MAAWSRHSRSGAHLQLCCWRGHAQREATPKVLGAGCSTRGDDSTSLPCSGPVTAPPNLPQNRGGDADRNHSCPSTTAQGASGASADNEPPQPRGQHPERRRSTLLPHRELHEAVLPRGRVTAGTRGHAGRSRGTVRGTPGRARPKPALPPPPPPRRGRGRAGSAPGRRATASLPPAPQGREKQREGNRENPESRGEALPPAAFVPRPGAASRQRRGGGRPRAHALAPRVRGRRAALPCSCHSPWLPQPPAGGARDPRRLPVSERRAAGRSAWGRAGRRRPGTSGLLTRRAAGRGAAHHPRPAGRASARPPPGAASRGAGPPGTASRRRRRRRQTPPPHVRYSRGARAALGLVVGPPRRQNYSSRPSPQRRPTCSARRLRHAAAGVGERYGRGCEKLGGSGARL